MIEDAVAEEERCALTESVHVHLSDTFQIKYSPHLVMVPAATQV